MPALRVTTDGPHLPRRPTGRGLLVAFGAVVVSFVLATAASEYRASAIDVSAIQIAETVAPNIEHLASARADLRDLQLVLTTLSQSEGFTRASERALREAHRRIDESLWAYLQTAPLPGQGGAATDLTLDLASLDQHLTDLPRSADNADWPGVRIAIERLQRSARRTADLALGALEEQAKESQRLALRIRRIRGRVMHLAVGLDALGLVIAAAAVLFVLRAARHYHTVVAENEGLLRARADELEQFAGRVAHDVMGPLTSVQLALDVADRATDDVQVHSIIARGRRGIGRARRIVQGLFEFARAGARPIPGARADVKDVIDDVIEGVAPAAAEARATLTVEPFERCEVACSPGVLTSLVSNLVRNAIKYLGDATARRVTVRVGDRGVRIRCEVEDTGPGLPAGLVERIFEPYVRGPNNTQPGMGLGLATVRKISDAHGGMAGVHSTPDQGCRFWFELPKAPPAPPGPPPA